MTGTCETCETCEVCQRNGACYREQRARAEQAERERDEVRRKLERVGALGDMAVLRAEDAERQLASSREEECEANVAVIAAALEREDALARIAKLEAALRDAETELSAHDKCTMNHQVWDVLQRIRAALSPKPTKEQP